MTDAIIKIVGFIIFLVAGFEGGIAVGKVSDFTDLSTLRWLLPVTVVSGLVGAVISPWLTIKPARYINRVIKRASVVELISAAAGMGVGLVLSALFTIPLSTLPSPFNKVLPVLVSLVMAYIGVVAAVTRHEDFLDLWRKHPIRRKAATSESLKKVLLDTSVIIDGRIADVSKTGFLAYEMIIPRFVLNELQFVADSSDALRRNRGRRGLEVLRRLQEDSKTQVSIIDADVPEARQVDDKLVQLARRMGAAIMTNDYNLNRVAALQGVKVLNVNDLANAVKTVVLPGEPLDIQIIQEGKEIGQGVGFLDDGTMVVVENGKRLIGHTVTVTVTKVLQTSAGKMIFAQMQGRPAQRR